MKGDITRLGKIVRIEQPLGDIVPAGSIGFVTADLPDEHDGEGVLAVYFLECNQWITFGGKIAVELTFLEGEQYDSFVKEYEEFQKTLVSVIRERTKTS